MATAGGAGTKGKVVAIKEWQKATLVSVSKISIPFLGTIASFTWQRSVAEVQWGEELKRNVYRIGHKGKV